MMKRKITATLLLIFMLGLVNYSMGAWVVSDGDRKYIVDRDGVRWDVSQAQSLGFIPQRFQYGIGKHAFTTLEDKDIGEDTPSVFSNIRIIGISNGNDAHAYAVDTLKHHEIANTTLGDEPIAAGYWPLVDLAAVYSRTLDGIPLTLAPSGWTYKNTFVLYDIETESLWYPYKKGLRGITGQHFNRWLPKLDAKDTRWQKWVKKHPDSKILQWFISSEPLPVNRDQVVLSQLSAIINAIQTP